jgi:uroporphyrinogen III methyltransferase / synthase
VIVYLVGAGPGDPGLLTVRGAELLRRADVVVHDRLLDPSLLDLAPAAAERIDMGKSPGGPIHQDEINLLLIEKARAGLQVVRLKGGDPFVLGRGGEEAEALAAAGIPFEVVPGITSAVAVPAYAGIPVTHRGLSTSFTVVTGHSRHAVDTETDWEALAQAAGTLVILMGVAHRAAIAKRLMDGGLPGDTPVAAIRQGTWSSQRTIRTTLAGLGDADLESPETIVIGRVAGLDLSWFETRPLFGKRVVVTRSREQASVLVSRLRELGADVVEIPTIEIVEPADGGAALRGAAKRVGAYDWVVFTSARAVERFMPLLRDARSLAGIDVAAVGSATALALAERGIAADLVPDRFVAEALVEAFAEGHGRVLIPQAADARDVLANGLRDKGWEVDVVEAYATRPVVLRGPVEADAITFTSSSTVTNFVAGGGQVPPVVVCIGPVTADTARECGLKVDAVAEEHSIEGLIEALLSRLKS